MSAPCYCGHAHGSHFHGIRCTRCGCHQYVPDTGREPDEPDPLEDPGAGERMYEKWLDRIGGS